MIVFNPGDDTEVGLPSGNWKKVFDASGKVDKTDRTAEGTAVTVFVKQ